MSANENKQSKPNWAYSGLVAGSLVGSTFGYFTWESWHFPERSDWFISLFCWGLVGGTAGFTIGVICTLLYGRKVAHAQWALLVGLLSGIVIMIIRDGVRYKEFRGLLTVIPGIMIGGVIGLVWAFNRSKEHPGKRTL